MVPISVPENVDWFGDKIEDSPAEMRENLPSCWYEWRPFCNFCDAKTVIYFEGKYLCLKHADEIFNEFLEVFQVLSKLATGTFSDET